MDKQCYNNVRPTFGQKLSNDKTTYNVAPLDNLV